jgi:polyisoprenoid-binding protein YceI
MKKTYIVLALLFSAAAAIATGWAPTTASVKFYIKNAGVTVDGSLSGLRASVNFDPNNLAASNITASVAVSTIKTGIEKRDEHLKTNDYFGASKYPRITMKSVSFTKKDATHFNGKFNLTIRNKTKQVNVPFTFTESGGKGKFVGSFNIDRLDYGVGESSWVLGDDVKVKIVLNSTKK